MNRKLYLLVAMLFISVKAFTQTPFWTEDFGTGCNAEQLATSYVGPNGSWTIVNTGTNQTSANTWFISATENGNAPGQCGSGCGNDRSLHLGALNSPLGSDLGAAYYEGLQGFCGFFPCAATNKRVESPTINCTGIYDITISFSYIEGGNAIDNATMWLYDGVSWSLWLDLGKTFSAGCSPQGLWTGFTAGLPSYVFNNPNVKIGFQWTNNDDGDATDPSFAVDDIELSADVNVDIIPPQLTCIGDQVFEANTDCEFILPNFLSQITVTDNVDQDVELTQSPAGPVAIGVGITAVTITATDDAGNSSTCTIEVLVDDATPPVLTCSSDVQVISANGVDAFVDVPAAFAQDNCSAVTLINDYNNTSDADGTYPLGITIVTWTATDVNGNSETCETTVNVVDGDCCTGDFNCDGLVGVSDLIFFMASYSCQGTCQADLSDDGVVGAADLLIFMDLFGTVCP